MRLDLANWGAKWDANGKRPYFVGHEREDVVAYREYLVNFITSKQYNFYQQTHDDSCSWLDPCHDPPYIIITHDESTVYSGETSSHRWLFPTTAPLHSKGRGRSVMLSYFLVQHKFCDLFQLTNEEWKEAIEQDPSLSESTDNVHYDMNSANAWIEPGKNKDGYFTNDVITNQFVRLFKLLKHKTIFSNHKILLLVDNATTHTAKKYDRNKLFKSLGTNCPYERLEWTDDNGVLRSVDCFFADNRTKSKGLFVLCK